jgi:DSF synthase
MNAVTEFPTVANTSQLRQIEVEYDADSSTMYWWMKPAPRPSFNLAFLEETARFERALEQHQGWMQHQGSQCRVEYAVFGSRVPGVFNLGGDLSMFVQAILRRDRESLTHYGNLCVDNMFRRITGFRSDIQTFSLVQGKAFGGGFECALSSDVLVAERSATFSFPEVLFNMFPGMGALSLLARKIGMRGAEEIIMSGRVFGAKEMHDLGVVDVLAEDGAGLDTARAMIQARQRKRNSFRAMSSAKREFQPVSHAEMRNVVAVWVDAALRLENRDLRMMARLVRAQDRLEARSQDDAMIDAICAPREEAMNW